jgi:hypothetical protein
VDTADQKPGEQPETVEPLLNSIHAYFAIFANCEQLSLADTEDSDVLCLKDVNHIGSTGLDLVEKLQDKLKALNPAPTPIVVAEDADPLAGLMELPLDRVVTVYLTSGQSLTGALAESPAPERHPIITPFPSPASAPGPTCEARTRMSCISTIGNI